MLETRAKGASKELKLEIITAMILHNTCNMPQGTILRPLLFTTNENTKYNIINKIQIESCANNTTICVFLE